MIDVDRYDCDFSLEEQVEALAVSQAIEIVRRNFKETENE